MIALFGRKPAKSHGDHINLVTTADQGAGEAAGDRSRTSPKGRILEIQHQDSHAIRSNLSLGSVHGTLEAATWTLDAVPNSAGRIRKTRPAPATTLFTTLRPAVLPARYCTAFIISKIGRYIATTMPPTITPRTTIMTGSMSESRADTATSTSSS
jgi:hypothetical protein